MSVHRLPDRHWPRLFLYIIFVHSRQRVVTPNARAHSRRAAEVRYANRAPSRRRVQRDSSAISLRRELNIRVEFKESAFLTAEGSNGRAFSDWLLGIGPKRLLRWA